MLESLHGAGAFSSAVLTNVALRPGRIQAIVPAGVQQERLLAFETGGLVSPADADRAVEEVLVAFGEEGGRCLVVEDDLARRGDPYVMALPFQTCFAGDRIVRWIEFSSPNGTRSAAGLIRKGASGYPRNALSRGWVQATLVWRMVPMLHRPPSTPSRGHSSRSWSPRTTRSPISFGPEVAGTREAG
jgi:hypothetical protein